MKKSSKILFIFILFIFILNTIGISLATETNIIVDENVIAEDAVVEEEAVTTESEYSEEEIQALQDNMHNGDMYRTDTNITIDNIIDGNAYLTGSTVTINNEIGGDLFVVANEVNLNSDIYGNVFVVANTVNIKGQVYYDVYCTATKLVLLEDSVIRRDLKFAGTTFDNSGTIGRNVTLTVKNIDLRDVSLIYGDLNYYGAEKIELNEELITGSYLFTQANIGNTTNNIKLYFVSLGYSLIYTLVLFALLLYLSPKFIEKANKLIKEKAARTFGIGIISLIGIFIGIIALMISIAGVFVSFAVTAIYILLLTIACPIVYISLANIIQEKLKLPKIHKNVWCILLINIIFWGLMLIPIIGIYIKLLLITFGFGILITSIFKKNKEEDITKIKE